jgi:uncharacterized hydrophobic protein (TIGR00271 family)
MVRTPASFIRRRLEKLLSIDPESKPRVYLQVFDSADIASLNYWLELLLSAGIATLGLVLNSPAVVIGAMLISPLMGPILAAGLALAAADIYLGVKSLLSLLMSIFPTIGFAALLVWLTPFHSPTSEILARTQPNLLDLGVAVLSGLAGSLVVCRGGTGGNVMALPGVAIAVALMPPLCTVGYGVGSGFSLPIIYGAGLLFVTNLVAITASAFLVFYAVRMDSADVREMLDRSIRERASREQLYRAFKKTPLFHGLGDIGKLRWRFLMLAVLFALLFIPLRRSLLQLRDETVARNAVRETIRTLAPSDSMLTQQVDLTPENIQVRLVVTSPLDQQKIEEAERNLIRATGRNAAIAVRRVTGEEELARLREQLRTQAPPPPPRSINELQADLVARLEPALQEIWPSETAPLLGYEIGFNKEETIIRCSYQSSQAFDGTVQEMLSKVLQSRLGAAKLRLVLERETTSQQPPQP